MRGRGRVSGPACLGLRGVGACVRDGHTCTVRSALVLDRHTQSCQPRHSCVLDTTHARAHTHVRTHVPRSFHGAGVLLPSMELCANQLVEAAAAAAPPEQPGQQAAAGAGSGELGPAGPYYEVTCPHAVRVADTDLLQSSTYPVPPALWPPTAAAASAAAAASTERRLTACCGLLIGVMGSKSYKGQAGGSLEPGSGQPRVREGRRGGSCRYQPKLNRGQRARVFICLVERVKRAWGIRWAVRKAGKGEGKAGGGTAAGGRRRLPLTTPAQYPPTDTDTTSVARPGPAPPCAAQDTTRYKAMAAEVRAALETFWAAPSTAAVAAAGGPAAAVAAGAAAAGGGGSSNSRLIALAGALVST